MSASLNPTPCDWDGCWDSGSYIRVVIRDLEVQASVGLHPWERHPERMTRLMVNVELFAALDGDLRGVSRQSMVDYDHIREAIKTWPTRAHTGFLETLLDEVVSLCFQGPRVEACRVSIMKPDIFNEAGAAGVEAYVLRSDYL